ncbi:MAG: DUF1549 domain-containing protein [Verrucomicrobiae bacterium]|nr:DUF1549 domain-containing protein [Verrucomicrobiae bacterium]
MNRWCLILGLVWAACGKSMATEAVEAAHWAFRPVQIPAPPLVTNTTWCRNPLDRFLLATWEAAGQTPVPRAGRRTLIRRATYGLTGMPPTAGAVEAFEADPAPDAFPRLVEGLLSSPRYGEHWGRHWLDVVRYADTAGETADFPVPDAWRYRNYVIHAFNADKPYDEFLREQIAGDLLARHGDRERYAERVTATGFIAVSRRFGFDSENYHHLTIQDTIDTVGQTFLGLTLGCARCHAHKYDPVSMTDYYALYGIFESTRYAFPGSEQKQKHRALAPLVPPQESALLWEAYEQRIARLAATLERAGQVVPGGILRSLQALDGDFEMQAPAAGGSKGVLVSPWTSEGPIAVLADAQSPFRNLHPAGRVGVRLTGGTNRYRMAQSLRPLGLNTEDGSLFVNLDARVGTRDPSATGWHGFWLGSASGAKAFEILISQDSLAVRTGPIMEFVRVPPPGQWFNMQFTIRPEAGTVSGVVGRPGDTVAFGPRSLSPDWDGAMDWVAIESAEPLGVPPPSLCVDNLAVQRVPIAAVSTTVPALAELHPRPTAAELEERLKQLATLEEGSDAANAASPPDSRVGQREVSTFGARRAEVAALRAELANVHQQAGEARRELETLLAEGPFSMTYAVSDGTPRNARLQVRGDPDRPGEEVPRGLLTALGGGPLPASALGSGRLELANWLASPAHPLTARVMVNRIWLSHFGQGLVRTPNDFGFRGQAPEIPGLLDFLASEFIRSGWSVKAMHRLIMGSAGYQMCGVEADGSASPACATVEYPDPLPAGRRAGAAARPEGRYPQTMVYPRRRLSAEELRDSVLWAGGTLDETPGAGHPFPSPITWSYTQHGPFSAEYAHNRRSVYLMTRRLQRHPFLALFDGPDPNASTPDRRPTTVPTQALYFLNDPFVHEAADQLAGTIAAGNPEAAARIQWVYRRVLGRNPTTNESAEGLGFLERYEDELAGVGAEAPGHRPLAAFIRVVLGSNEFLTVE